MYFFKLNTANGKHGEHLEHDWLCICWVVIRFEIQEDQKYPPLQPESRKHKFHITERNVYL